MKFDYSRNFKSLDFRAHPELNQIGVGEQGVLLVEPCKSEILPHWRFKSPETARQSAEAIYAMFLRYKAEGWVWTWPGSFYKWGIRALGAMPIIKVAEDIPRTIALFCPTSEVVLRLVASNSCG